MTQRVSAATTPSWSRATCLLVLVSAHLFVVSMSNRRIALVFGTVVGLIAIVAWVAEIDIVFQESAEEQEPNQKSLVIEGTSSEEKAITE